LIHSNIKQGFDDFALFEIGKTHSKQDGLNEENVPNESGNLALISAKKNPDVGARFYQVKRLLEYLANVLGLNFIYTNLDFEDQSTKPFEPKRSAAVVDADSGEKLGVLGEYRKSVIKSFKLPDSSAGFELNMDKLFEKATKKSPGYKPLSRYPSSERDICFRVKNDIQFGKIINAVKGSKVPENLDIEISPLDIYQPESGDTKNITIRVKLTSYERTLTGNEVNSVVKSLSDSVVGKIQAEVI